MTDKQTAHLYCLMQNRLGAMDRVLNALTHRGIIPERMVTAMGRDNSLEMMISFTQQDEKSQEKLVKFLQKQIYVLDARMVNQQADSADATTAETNNITPLFVSDVISDYTQRRLVNVNNA